MQNQFLLFLQQVQQITIYTKGEQIQNGRIATNKKQF